MAAPADRKPFDRALVDGPIGGAVWKLAWPTMLQNVIGGLQGVVDHAMVGHFVGYAGNAGIGVAVQIFIVVFVFVASLFTGMSVLVARFAGADRPDQVNRTVYQAFLAAIAFCLFVLAPVGWLLSPPLLSLVHAAPEVQAQALPYLRILFVSGVGFMLFHMLGAALRSAGDARTPLRLGVAMTALNVAFNVVLIRGWGPIPALGTAGAALGTVLAGALVSGYAIYRICAGGLVVHWQRGMALAPDWPLLKALFRLGLPTGVQGVAMNVAGVLLLRFIGSLPSSAEAQAAYAVGYTELFSLITWTSVGLMGATAAVVGQNLGAGRSERAVDAARVGARLGLLVAVGVGGLFLAAPGPLLRLFGMTDPSVVAIARQLLAFLSVSGLFVTVALVYTGALQGSGDTRSPLLITIASQIVVPLGICAALDAGDRLAAPGIWSAIVAGHATRCLLSVWRFRQGKWREIDLGVGGAERPAP
jgi:putative MATE family efflux protein